MKRGRHTTINPAGVDRCQPRVERSQARADHNPGGRWTTTGNPERGERIWPLQYAVAAIVCLFCSLLCSSLPSAEQPNIVLILSDDQGWHQAGCYGSDFYETPNIDRLASAGMRFTDAYAACHVCSPTRASLMTGKYPARLHVTDHVGGKRKVWHGLKLLVPEWNWNIGLPLEETTLAESLRAAGYATGHFGKWHLNRDKKYQPGRPGDPASQGFDDVLTTHKPGAGPASKYENDAHHVREITERSIAFMEAHRNQPFFCYVTHNSIHNPIMEREELVALYQAKPGSDRADHNPTVGAMVDTLDKSVGTLLDQLDNLGLADNTIVVYTSDNGCKWGPEVLKPLRGGKAELYEGGIRVPLIVRWPAVVEPGSLCAVPVITNDFYPTLIEAAGEKCADPEGDGLSLLPLLTQTGNLDRDAIYWHYPHYHKMSMAPGGAIRQGRYKLIEWFEKSIDGIDTPGAIELFDLEKDLSEQHDLAKDRPELALRMYEKLADWRLTVRAQMMIRNPQ